MAIHPELSWFAPGETKGAQPTTVGEKRGENPCFRPSWLALFAIALAAVGCGRGVDAGEHEQAGYPISLVKVFDRDCLLKAGETFIMAKVEKRALCESIARAYNFARTADRPEQLSEFGSCWSDYHFTCEGEAR